MIHINKKTIQTFADELNEYTVYNATLSTIYEFNVDTYEVGDICIKPNEYYIATTGKTTDYLCFEYSDYDIQANVDLVSYELYNDYGYFETSEMYGYSINGEIILFNDEAINMALYEYGFPAQSIYAWFSWYNKNNTYLTNDQIDEIESTLDNISSNILSNKTEEATGEDPGEIYQTYRINLLTVGASTYSITESECNEIQNTLINLFSKYNMSITFDSNTAYFTSLSINTSIITTTLTNLTSSGDTTIDSDSTASVTLVADSGYTLPTTISVSGATYTYNSSTGVISLSSPIGNVTITASGVPNTYSITTTLTNLTSSGDTTIDSGSTASVTLVADSGYILPTTISVSGATYTYDSSTGVISLSSPTGNVTITASATRVNYFNIILYKNSAESNRVDKTNYLTKVDTLSGTLREESSIISPTLTINRDKIDFNYVYIPIFNRYYYVSEILSLRNNLWQVILTCDVLMSYKEGIYNSYGFVERNETTYNEDIIDNYRVIEMGANTIETTINNDLFSMASYIAIIQGFYVYAN